MSIYSVMVLNWSHGKQWLAFHSFLWRYTALWGFFFKLQQISLLQNKIQFCITLFKYMQKRLNVNNMTSFSCLLPHRQKCPNMVKRKLKALTHSLLLFFFLAALESSAALMHVMGFPQQGPTWAGSAKYGRLSLDFHPSPSRFLQ